MKQEMDSIYRWLIVKEWNKLMHRTESYAGKIGKNQFIYAFISKLAYTVNR